MVAQRVIALSSFLIGLAQAVCPLTPLPDELFITAATVRTNQRRLSSISDRESPHIDSGPACLCQTMACWCERQDH